MTIKIKHKRGTASSITTANPTLAAGELAFETDTRRFKVGDGTTAWSSLSYVTPYVTATDRILGRSSAGAGSAEELTCTAAGRALLSGADAAAQRTTLSVQPTASPAFTGAATFANTGNVVPLTVTNAGTANSFVVNDQSGDPTPFVIDASGHVGIKATSTASSLNVVGNSAFYQDANGTPSLGSKSFYAATFENFSAGYGLAIGGVSGATGACIIQVQSFTISAAYDMLLQPLGGNVGIGTTAPSNKLSVSNAGAEGLELIPAQNANESRIQSYNRASAAWNKFSINCSTFEVFCNGGTSAIAIATTAAVTLGGQLLVTAGSVSACGVAFSGDANTGLAQIGGADTASLVTAGVERVRVGSNGRVQFFANSEKFGVQLNNGSTGNGPFLGSDGADILTISTSGGAERVRVDAGGNVGIGVTPAANTTSNVQASGDITLYGASRGFLGNLYFQSGWKYAGTGHGWGWIEGSGSVDFSRTSSSGTAGNTATLNTAIRINSDSEVLIGTTTDQGNFKLQVAGNTYLENLYLSTTVNYGRLAISHAGATTFAAGWNNTDTSSTGQTTLNILRNGVSVGTISTTNAATSYNTTSDYRLKANPRPITNATERIARIKPSQWDWHVGGVGEGFIAHELVDAVPLAVTGEKDAVDATGNPVWQTVDMSKVVPVLVAALQEANARIAALEERINA